MAVDFNTTKHPVAFPSRIKSGHCGHTFDVALKDDMLENGNLVALGDYIKLGTYKEAAATTFQGIVREKSARGNWYVEVVNPGNSLFVFNAPISPYDLTELKDESVFYISKAKDQMAKAYELAKWDIFEVSEDGFDGDVEEGASVTVANKRLKVTE